MDKTLSKAHNGSQTIKLILAWAFVGIPLLWGISETAGNAMRLFR
jgi:hypothetical protein